MAHQFRISPSLKPYEKNLAAFNQKEWVQADTVTNTETGSDILSREELGSDAIIQEDRWPPPKNHHVVWGSERREKREKMRYELGVIPASAWLLLQFSEADDSFVWRLGGEGLTYKNVNSHLHIYLCGQRAIPPGHRMSGQRRNREVEEISIQLGCQNFRVLNRATKKKLDNTCDGS